MTSVFSEREVAPDIRPLRDAEFRSFQRLIMTETGIWLADGKRALLISRITRRIRELGLPSYGDYYQTVTSSGGAPELTRLIDAVCTHETQFFREPRQFEYLEQTIIPQWVEEGETRRRPRRLRIWSAACSSGEEPYSIAMCLLARLPVEPAWELEIIATDISTRILAQARKGVWPLARAEQIPEPYLRRYMRRGVREQHGLIAAGQELRQVIRFARLNLSEPTLADIGTFDAIFCRNALIYFEPAGRRQAQSQLVQRLTADGYLFLGHAESLDSSEKEMARIRPTIYRRRAE